MNDLPKCPWCGTNKHVRLTGFRHFYCANCAREFDDSDDGDIGYGSPSRRIEREERKGKGNKR
jgi:transposase-like protein